MLDFQTSHTYTTEASSEPSRILPMKRSGDPAADGASRMRRRLVRSLGPAASGTDEGDNSGRGDRPQIPASIQTDLEREAGSGAGSPGAGDGDDSGSDDGSGGGGGGGARSKRRRMIGPPPPNVVADLERHASSDTDRFMDAEAGEHDHDADGFMNAVDEYGTDEEDFGGWYIPVPVYSSSQVHLTRGPFNLHFPPRLPLTSTSPSGPHHSKELSPRSKQKARTSAAREEAAATAAAGT